MCGGSSGGSGAAVAAGLVDASLGTDTAGSVRIPAAFCGVTGIRPSWGLVSTRGVLPTAWSLDTVGPLAQSAEECEWLLEIMAERPLGGRHGGRRPPGGRPHEPVRARRACGGDGVRAGARRVAGPEGAGNAPVARGAVHDHAADHAPGGRERPPSVAAHAPRRLRRRRPGAAAGGPASAADRVRDGPARAPLGTRGARARARRLRRARGAGDADHRSASRCVPEDYRLLLMPYNSPAALLGLPALSVPCGFVDGLPVGLALTGRRGEDGTPLAAAKAFQQATDWHAQRPERALARVAPAPVDRAGRRLYTTSGVFGKGWEHHVRSHQGRPDHHRGRRLRRRHLRRQRLGDADRRVARRRRRQGDRRVREVRDPGSDRPAHAHRDVLRRHNHVRRLHVGHRLGGVRRHDDGDRLLHAGAGLPRSPRRSRTITRRSTAASR